VNLDWVRTGAAGRPKTIIANLGSPAKLRAVTRMLALLEQRAWGPGHASALPLDAGRVSSLPFAREARKAATPEPDGRRRAVWRELRLGKPDFSLPQG
jgi:hypothetical protein